ncbi:MAG: thiamine-monophosphate kinase [Anaerosporomusa subterranea]|nr:thiamine-monophosphate kinase [Anaerosporomusa subterranea]
MQVRQMNLKTLGEFGLIDLIKQGTIVEPNGLELGIGDDAAAFWPAPGRLQLLTADMLVETVHFDLKWISPWQLGYKSLAVNISDIAAMGGRPRQAAVSLSLPQTSSVEFVVELYEGMKSIGREYGVNIIGGDTVSSPGPIVINVTLSGDVVPERMIRRSGACPGDLVLVTGCLGDSAAGLAWLLAENPVEQTPHLISAHLTPKPQVSLGQAAAAAGATAMDDVSDGLASEANEIANASQVGIIIYADKIPLSSELQCFASRNGQDCLDYALYGGEDYQLLFTMPPQAAQRFLQLEIAGSCRVIGEVCSERQVTLIANDGSKVAIKPKGYNHFR